MHIATGEVFADRYRVLAPIGRGGMGHVHRAFDFRLRRPVALKLLHETLSPESMARLVREARLAASLSHPNIVQVFDVGEHQGIPFMAMELIDGRQLRVFIGSPVPVQDKIRWLADVARALDSAHRSGLVHRDIKPQNVMITPTGAKVLDFGIAKEMDEAQRKLTALLPSMRTQPGFSVGTPQYMAPEVLRGEHPSDPRTDQYSWGLIAYQLLSGRGVLRDNLLAKWAPPKIDAFGVSERVAGVVMRALDDDRNNRFESMAVVANALEGTQPIAHEQPPPPPPPPDERAPKFEHTRFFPVQMPEVPDLELPKAKIDPRAEIDTPPAVANPKPKPKPIREPTRAVLQPFTDATLAELSVSVPLGFRKAVVIVTLDIEADAKSGKEKVRFFVQLVALDETAEMWAPDATQDLVRAAGSLIKADALDGNGRWQRLVLRLQRGSREATVTSIE